MSTSTLHELSPFEIFYLKFLIVCYDAKSSSEINLTTPRCMSAERAASKCDSRDIVNPQSRIEYDSRLNFSDTLGQFRQLQPTKVDIWLRPGDTKNFTFYFKPAKDYPLDLYFLIDFSESMDAAVARTAERDISNGLRDLTNNIYLGLGSFIDKKTVPYTFASLGSNYDPSEGGLDALAQVLACKEKIGWRNDSRKIIIFLTDQSYHVAGDGKWAGIFTPYDGQCYMENNQYTKELEMDYPSKLSQTLSMQLNIKDVDFKHMDVEIDPDCMKRSSDNDQCKIVSKSRDIKNFTVKVTLKDYYGVNDTAFNIIPKGFREKLDVNVHVIDKCECEERGERNAVICNKHGIYQCGICQCDSDSYGSNCQCKGVGDNNDNSTCIASNSKLLCSGGRGACKCGKCECYDGYEGQYCEFSKDDCPGKTRNGVCSTHGTCQLGSCVCHTGWAGERCDCPTSTEYCRHLNDVVPSSDEECSGLGDCVCGKCKCRQVATWDSRRQNSEYCYLEPCAECHEQQCQTLELCALCQHKNVNSNLTCMQICHSEFVVHKTKDMLNYTEPWQICRLTTDLGCFTQFAYKYAGANRLELHVNTQENCTESYYKFGASALFIVLLVGLVTLIAWKILTTLRDRRDYEAFKKQHREAEWEHGRNPIYESPNMTFYNPSFGQS
ncbi:Integrin beta-PS [Eumeta japonica]|uniref:Integrin beta n=1 Tax=Eumeta variegata TaxID=151549 RepID=A0A4C1V4D8_EUMVA|nr:Integrin beta-PS [Eumeta japonica]